jgi:hypothetical protein
VRFHRNGVAGAGFYMVAFRVREGGEARNMVGVVFPGNTDSWQDSLATATYAVVNPADIDDRRRGDAFWPELREIVRAANENGSAYTARTYVGAGPLPADVIDAATGEVTQ